MRAWRSCKSLSCKTLSPWIFCKARKLKLEMIMLQLQAWDLLLKFNTIAYNVQGEKGSLTSNSRNFQAMTVLIT